MTSDATAAEEQTLASVHEAGHAVVARAVGHGILSVSLDGVRTRYRDGDRHAHMCEAMIALAGPAAEQHYRPAATPAEREALRRDQWRSDLDNARRHGLACGADEPLIDCRVRALVRRHWPAITRVAAALLERGALTAAEVDALMRG